MLKLQTVNYLLWMVITGLNTCIIQHFGMVNVNLKLAVLLLGATLRLYCHNQSDSFFFIITPTDALISEIYFVKKVYMFRAVPVPIIRSFPLYIRYWYMS